MGIYLNPSNDKFSEARNSEIYVDKSELIKYTNKVLHTSQKCICVSRPRRFGKSMAANMLAAYYSRGCDSEALFDGLKIKNSPDFHDYLNRYDVIALNMQDFLSRTHHVLEMLKLLMQLVTRELKREYPDVDYFDLEDLIQTMQDIYAETGRSFIILIDEWDCVLRECKDDLAGQKQYLDFLRDFLKDKGYIHLVYMTGILPIKKYGTHSALNMFREFSMTDAGELAEFVGFTEAEVQNLCETYHADFEEMKQWYNGYRLRNVGAVYNPQSVVFSILSGAFNNYWNQTETYEALKIYIDLNYDGLKNQIIRMMQGDSVSIDIGSFNNDMTSFASRDDVLTLLIHLGYLGYDSQYQEAFIPNNEILNEFANAVRNSDWGEVTKALELSRETLQAIWNQNEEYVAWAIEQSHLETSYFQYNDENALSYTISLALYAAKNYYTVIRELPAGKGRADLVFIPRKQFPDKPALLVELKWNQVTESAIEQIKDKKYPKALEEYQGNLLLVGISYDKKTKEHKCKIEELRY